MRDDDYHGHGGHDAYHGHGGHDAGGGGCKGRGYQRGLRRGRGYRGRGRKSEFNSRRSDDWKYEKYEMEEPSSTTD